MTPRRVASTVAFLVAASLTSVAARADSTDADRATARLLAQEGREALVAKDFTKAADRFRRAEALLHAPTLQLGLALAEAGLGHLVSAQEIYRRIVREGVPANASAAFVKAVEDARKELTSLEPRVPLLTIEVEGARVAEVTLDGVAIPSAAIGVARPVDPGRRVIVVRAEGRKPVELTVSLVERQRLTVPIKLEVDATPAPQLAPPVAPKAGGDPAAQPPPESPPVARGGGLSGQGIAGIASLAVGGAGLAVGAIMGGFALAKHDELAAICPGATCSLAVPQSRLDEYAAFGSASTWAFVVGGALVVSGVVLVATAPRGPRLSAVVGPSSLGLSGRF